MGRKIKDMTGLVFGRWTVLECSGKDKRKQAMWLCRCVCGEERVVRGSYLRSGNSTSCGCYKREAVSKAFSKGFNDYRIEGDWLYIRLENKKGEVVGETKTNAVFLFLMRLHRWYLDDKGYVCTDVRQSDGTYKRLYMHHILRPPSEGMEVDHIDRDKCNNDIFNLRYCTHQQNMANKAPRSESGYKSVYRNGRGGNWIAKIQKDGKTYYLGTYPTKEEAALAYNEKALEFFGEFAYLNGVSQCFSE